MATAITPAVAHPSSDSGIEISSDTSKTAWSPAATDTEKEVIFEQTPPPKPPRPPKQQDAYPENPEAYNHIPDSKEIFAPHRQGSWNTHKIFVPKLPPVSLEKEVAAPTDDTDKQLVLANSTSSRSISSASAFSPSAASTPSSAFRIEKSNAFGMILPKDQKLLVRVLDPTTQMDGGPALVTNEMNWTDVWSANPPVFELYTAHDPANTALVARWLPRGWQGFTGVWCEFEVSAQGDRQKWEVVRKGLNRTYQLNGLLSMYGRQFVWKGSTKTIRSMIGEGQKNKGNLKLTTPDGKEVLAVWQQWRDSHVLGDVIIFETARDKLAVETILTSCIGVVSAERANGLNWFGGLGK